MGNVGGVIFFVLSLVGATIVSAYVLTHAAYCLLVVVEATAAGADEVPWSNEIAIDRVARSVWLFGLLALCLAPAGMLARSLRADLFPDSAALRFLVLAVPGLWLFFPVGLLSALSATSRWAVFRPAIVSALARVWLSTLAFFGVTALLAAVVAVSCHFAAPGGSRVLALVSPLAAAGLLIYGRLLGRLAWQINRLKLPDEKPEDRPPEAKPRRRRKPRPPAGSTAPWGEVEWPRKDDLDDVTEALVAEDDLPAPESPPEQEPESGDLPTSDPDEIKLLPEEHTGFVRPVLWDEADEDVDPYDVSDATAKTPVYRRPEEEDFDEMGPKVPEREEGSIRERPHDPADGVGGRHRPRARRSPRGYCNFRGRAGRCGFG